MKINSTLHDAAYTAAFLEKPPRRSGFQADVPLGWEAQPTSAHQDMCDKLRSGSAGVLRSPAITTNPSLTLAIDTVPVSQSHTETLPVMQGALGTRGYFNDIPECTVLYVDILYCVMCLKDL